MTRGEFYRQYGDMIFDAATKLQGGLATFDKDYDPYLEVARGAREMCFAEAEEMVRVYLARCEDSTVIP